MDRRYFEGPELRRDDQGALVANFRVFAPAARSVALELQGRAAQACRADGDGYWTSDAQRVEHGQRYRYRLDALDPMPDPASRWQPEGPHAASALVVDSFAWTDAAWRGCSLPGQVVYELHIGTFSPEGTWASAMARLESLVEVGVTLIEMMPVAEFPGAFGWGYDGVTPWAPYHGYGTPDDLRRFVNRAHELSLGVVLDVVYNHLGPDGNYLFHYNPNLFSEKHQTDWGSALNFDGEGSAGLRRFFIENAAYWVREFHFDGLRLDATQNIYDESRLHVLAEIGTAARAAAGERAILLIAENEPQDTHLVRPLKVGEHSDRSAGYGLDALWNDDYHHAASVALTGRHEAYYSDYRGSPQELVSALKWGTLFQGQLYAWQKNGRGTPALDLAPPKFVVFLQNHDQIANTARGLRGNQLGSPARWRALTALTMLSPGTPMLFQGEEFSASAPFLFFADHGAELAGKVRTGRGEFLKQFPSLSGEDVQSRLTDPASRRTFESCKLDWTEKETHAEAYALHRDLLQLRKGDSALCCQRRFGVDGAVLGDQAFVLRYFDRHEPPGTGAMGDRLLLVNLGPDLEVRPMSEPLLGPPRGARWERRWHSEDPLYGGAGAPAPFDARGQLWLPAESATLVEPVIPPAKEN